MCRPHNPRSIEFIWYGPYLLTPYIISLCENHHKFLSMVFYFATIAFNGFQWFRTIGLAIAEIIGQLLTLTIWSNLEKFHYILGGSTLSFSWKSEALTANVANISVFTKPNISVTGSHSGSLVQYKCKKSTSGQCLLFHSAQYASDANKHKEHNATKAIHASRCN